MRIFPGWGWIVFPREEEFFRGQGHEGKGLIILLPGRQWDFYHHYQWEQEITKQGLLEER